MKEHIVESYYDNFNNQIRNKYPRNSLIYGLDRKFIGRVFDYYRRTLGGNKYGEIIGVTVINVKSLITDPEFELTEGEEMPDSMWNLEDIARVSWVDIVKLISSKIIS